MTQTTMGLSEEDVRGVANSWSKVCSFQSCGVCSGVDAGDLVLSSVDCFV